MEMMHRSFGEVYVAKRNADGWDVAIKVVQLNGANVMEECKTLQKCHSLFIVRYDGCYIWQDRLWV